MAITKVCRVSKLMSLYNSKWLFINILMILPLLLCLLGKGNANALLRSSALEDHQEAVANENENASSPAANVHALRTKSEAVTPLEKITRRLGRDISNAAGSRSCRKLYQDVSRSTLTDILQNQLQGRKIVFPATVSLPYCIGSCNKVTYSNYHQLIRHAHHGHDGNRGFASVCQAKGERMILWIVAVYVPAADNRRASYTYELLKIPLEITKCSCYPRY